MARKLPERSASPTRHRGSPSRRERSPLRTSDRKSGRIKSPKRESPRASVSRSPSPRTKRLKRAHVDKDAARVKEREREKRNGRLNENNSHGEREREKGREAERGRGKDREKLKDEEKPRDQGRERGKERERERGSGREDRYGRDEMDGKSSKSRREKPASPGAERSHTSRRRSRSPRHDEENISRGQEERNDESDSLAKMRAAESELEAKKKEQPSFELSGKLAAETNRFRGVTLLFNEPPDARKPSTRWRLYVFKAGEMLNEPLYIHRQTCYLFGRERRVADVPTDHPSCSKQHAVIQFRQIEKEQPDGTMSKEVRPYIMDLGSTNKTYINDTPVEPERYYELFEKDTIRFGNSSREYVLLHEDSA